MRLTLRSTILLAPVLALILLQIWAFRSDLGRAGLENVLIGIVILKSNIPIHGSPAFPWIIIPFHLLCIGIWEVLETIRRPRRLASWRATFSNYVNFAKWLSRYCAGFGISAAVLIVLNFIITISIPIIYLPSKTLSSPGATVVTIAMGTLCPLFLGYPALLSYCRFIRNVCT